MDNNPRPKSKCKICQKESVLRLGMCATHYMRLRRTGTVADPVIPTCKAPGCIGKHYAKGMCRNHQEYLRRNGDFGIILICKKEGCGALLRRDNTCGYCVPHKYIYNSTRLNHRLANNLRVRLRKALKGISKSAATLTLIGCTLEALKTHLEAKFQDGMSWENYGDLDGCWHVDHIRAISKYDLSSPEQQREACNFTNLQPMWATENRRKNNT